MRMDQKRVENIQVITPHGRLDASSAPLLREHLSAAGASDARKVVDFSFVEFMDSSGLGALVASVRRLREVSGDLKIACLPDPVRQVFEMTSADRLFDIYDDADAAASSFRTST